MEFIMELIVEVLLEGSLEISKNRLFPKWIRYPLIFIIVLIFIIMIVALMFLGMFYIKENVFIGVLLILISVIIFFASIAKFKNTYMKRKEEHEKI